MAGTKWVLSLWICCWVVAVQTWADAMQKPALVVATAADYPPVVFEQDGEVRGLEADLLALLSAQLNRPMTFKQMSWDALLPALEAGEVDIVMSGMTMTPERSKRVDFTDPYLDLAQMAIIRVADAARFGTPGGLYRPDARLGYEAGTTGAEYVKSLPNAGEAVAFKETKAGLQALLSGQIDAYVHDAPTSWYIATRPEYRELMSLYRPLTTEQIALAVAKSEPALQERLNVALLALRETGKLDYLVNRWMPVRVTVE